MAPSLLQDYYSQHKCAIQAIWSHKNNPIRTTVFALSSKNLQTTHTWNSLTFPNFWFRIPLWFFFLQNFFVYSLWQHCCDTQYKNIFLFFALIKKFFLQPLVEIFFRHHKKYFRFLGPPGTPLQPKRRKVKISHMKCWVTQ